MQLPAQAFVFIWQQTIASGNRLPPGRKVRFEPLDGTLLTVVLGRIDRYLPVVSFQRGKCPQAAIGRTEHPIRKDRNEQGRLVRRDEPAPFFQHPIDVVLTHVDEECAIAQVFSNVKWTARGRSSSAA